MRLREVVHLVFAGIDAARGDRVQERLPEMGPGTFDQSDRRPLAPAEAIAELCDQFKSRGAATDHDDAVQCLPVNARVRCRHRGILVRARRVLNGLAV
jgi:hypothetical protein